MIRKDYFDLQLPLLIAGDAKVSELIAQKKWKEAFQAAKETIDGDEIVLALVYQDLQTFLHAMEVIDPDDPQYMTLVANLLEMQFIALQNDPGPEEMAAEIRELQIKTFHIDANIYFGDRKVFRKKNLERACDLINKFQDDNLTKFTMRVIRDMTNSRKKHSQNNA